MYLKLTRVTGRKEENFTKQKALTLCSKCTTTIKEKVIWK